MTAPALDVWKLTFGLTEPDQQDVFVAIAATHRNIVRLRQQMTTADPQLLLDCSTELDSLSEAFSMRRLEDPWNNTRQLLGDRVRLSLRACAAALDGRFDEKILRKEQIGIADQLLYEFQSNVRAEGLPTHIEMFMMTSIDELRTALRYMETLGTREFVALADNLTGDLGRVLATRHGDEQSVIRKVARALGITVASISAAVTMGIGVLDIDQKTLNLLPWGDQVDPAIVKCVVDVREIPPMARSGLDQVSPTGETK